MPRACYDAPMRYLFAADKYLARSGGADRSARAIVSALVTAGHEVRVLQAGPAPDERKTDTATGGATVVTRPLPPYRWIRDGDWRGVRWNIFWQPHVQAEIESFRPDIVLTQNMLAPGSVAAARVAGVASVVFFRGYRCLAPDFFRNRDALTSPPTDFWNAPFTCKLKWVLTGSLLDLHDAAYRAASLVVANSDYTAKVVERFFERPAGVLYPTIDLADTVAPCPCDPADPVLFIKPQPIKGVETVLELARRMPERRFVVAGTASRGIRRRLANQTNIDHKGWVDDMDALYRSSSVLLAPARIPEPFGRVFVEAGLRGVPSVATDAGGIPEAAGPGGQLVPMNASPDAWQTALAEALEPKRHATLSAAAHAHARDVLAKHNPERLRSLLATL